MDVSFRAGFFHLFDTLVDYETNLMGYKHFFFLMN